MAAQAAPLSEALERAAKHAHRAGNDGKPAKRQKALESLQAAYASLGDFLQGQPLAPPPPAGEAGAAGAARRANVTQPPSWSSTSGTQLPPHELAHLLPLVGPLVLAEGCAAIEAAVDAADSQLALQALLRFVQPSVINGTHGEAQLRHTKHVATTSVLLARAWGNCPAFCARVVELYRLLRVSEAAHRAAATIPRHDAPSSQQAADIMRHPEFTAAVFRSPPAPRAQHEALLCGLLGANLYPDLVWLASRPPEVTEVNGAGMVRLALLQALALARLAHRVTCYHHPPLRQGEDPLRGGATRWALFVMAATVAAGEWADRSEAQRAAIQQAYQQQQQQQRQQRQQQHASGDAGNAQTAAAAAAAVAAVAAAAAAAAAGSTSADAGQDDCNPALGVEGSAQDAAPQQQQQQQQEPLRQRGRQLQQRQEEGEDHQQQGQQEQDQGQPLNGRPKRGQLDGQALLGRLQVLQEQQEQQPQPAAQAAVAPDDAADAPSNRAADVQRHAAGNTAAAAAPGGAKGGDGAANARKPGPAGAAGGGTAAAAQAPGGGTSDAEGQGPDAQEGGGGDDQHPQQQPHQQQPHQQQQQQLAQRGATAPPPVQPKCAAVLYLHALTPLDPLLPVGGVVAAYEACGLLGRVGPAAAARGVVGLTWPLPCALADELRAECDDDGAATCQWPIRAVYELGVDRQPRVMLGPAAALVEAARHKRFDFVTTLLLDNALGRAIERCGGPSSPGQVKVGVAVLLPVAILSGPSTFSFWHIEDAALGALNEHCWGSYKVWLLVPNKSVGRALVDLVASCAGGNRGVEALHKKQLRLHRLPLERVLACGVVPLVQKPGMTVATGASCFSLHTTVSSGLGLAQAANCYYGPDLRQHLADMTAKGGALVAGNHKDVADSMRELRLWED